MSRVQREIVVQAPADTVYQLWRRFENFPNFMSNIEEVEVVDDRRSHWRAKGPIGQSAEWDAEITRDEPGRAIAWRSLESPKSDVETTGAVTFEEQGESTVVHVELAYHARAGGLAETVAKIFANPGKQVEEDLRRFKETIESQPGYERATERIAGAGTPDRPAPRGETHFGETDVQGPRGEERVTESPLHSSAPGGIVQPGPIVRVPPPDDDRTVGHGPANRRPSETHRGPGMAANHPPATTSTPGGTLGAPTEGDLKENPEEPSERNSV